MPHFALLRRRLAVWLVVLIALFGALAPTLSHALVWSQGGTSAWTEVCTSTGTRWVMMGSSAPNAAPQIASAFPISTASPQPQEAAFFLDHCPFCLLTTDRAAPPPNALLHLFVVPGEIEAPTIRQAFFFVTHFALTPPLRGPPASL